MTDMHTAAEQIDDIGRALPPDDAASFYKAVRDHCELRIIEARAKTGEADMADRHQRWLAEELAKPANERHPAAKEL